MCQRIKGVLLWGLPSGLGSLPAGLEQDDSRRYRDIQAVDVAEHGDGRQEVAPFADQPAEPGSFGADH